MRAGIDVGRAYAERGNKNTGWIARGFKNKTPDPNFPVSTGKTAYQTTMSDGTKLQMVFDGEVLDSAFPNLR